MSLRFLSTNSTNRPARPLCGRVSFQGNGFRLSDRLIFAAASLALLSPTTSFKLSIVINLLGLVVAILLAGREYHWRYRAQRDRNS